MWVLLGCNAEHAFEGKRKGSRGPDIILLRRDVCDPVLRGDRAQEMENSNLEAPGWLSP